MPTITTVPSTNSNTALDQLVRQVVTAADSDKDGQMSTGEFAAFLTKLLDQISPGLVASTLNQRAVLASSQNATAPAAAPKVYAAMGGFNTDKLNDLTHNTPKYVFARAVQDLGLSGATTRNNLQPLVDEIRRKGFENAQAVGDDKIDFGDGFGAVDVITSWGDWWWGV